MSDPYNQGRAAFERDIKPLIDRIRASQGEDDVEYFAAGIVHYLRAELGWSLAYHNKADARHYWCLTTGRDEDDLTAEQQAEFEAFWSTWRYSKAWDDALWLDEYTGDSIVYLIEWHLGQLRGRKR